MGTPGGTSHTVRGPVVGLTRFLRVGPGVFAGCFLAFTTVFLAILVILNATLVLFIGRCRISRGATLLGDGMDSVTSAIRNALVARSVGAACSIRGRLLYRALTAISGSVGTSIFIYSARKGVVLYESGTINAPNCNIFPTYDIRSGVVVGDGVLSAMCRRNDVIRGAGVSNAGYFIINAPVCSRKHVVNAIFTLTGTNIRGFSVTIFEVFLVYTFFYLVFTFVFVCCLAGGVIAPLRRVDHTTGRFTMNSFSCEIGIRNRSRLTSLNATFGSVTSTLSILRNSQHDFISGISRRLGAPVASVSKFVSNVLSNAVPHRGRSCCLGVIDNRIGELSELIISVLGVDGVRDNSLRVGPSGCSVSSRVVRVLLAFRRGVRGGGVRVHKLSRFEPACVITSPSVVCRSVCGLISGTIGFAGRNNCVSIHLVSSTGRVALIVGGDNANVGTRSLSEMFREFCGTSGDHDLSTGNTKLKLCLIGLVIRVRNNEMDTGDRDRSDTRFSVALPGRFDPICVGGRRGGPWFTTRVLQVGTNSGTRVL